VAYALARGLAAHGVAVVSGLARGVDAAAHRGALDAGGRSGAVLGTGPDRCYPKEHRELQDSLARSLGLMTELPPGAAPTRSTFAARNRLLAAISSAVVLVQGRTGSGALLTVEAARRMARPVGAIPWDSREPLGHAPHALIRARTAVLVRDAADVLELIAATASASAAARAARPVADAGPPASDAALGDLEFDPRHALGERETRLFRALRHHPRPLDEAAERAGLPASEAGAAFVILELQGLARRDPGGVVRLTRRA
jgi:DNA processing protein